MPTCSVIVPVFQHPAILDLFLESLWNTVELPSQVVLVNDGSGADAQRVLASWAARQHPLISVEILAHDRPQGAALSRNEALQRARGEVVFLADSDLVLLAGWQRALLDALGERPRIGCAGALLLYPQTGGIQHCGITFSADIGRHLYLNGRPEFLDGHCFEVQAVVFALCALTRPAIEAAGPIDEAFFNAYEDFDYMLRLRSLGFEVVVQPRARAYHWEQRNGRHRSMNQKRHLGRFWRTWGNAVEPDLGSFLSRRIRSVASTLAPAPLAGYDLCCDRADVTIIWQTFAATGWPVEQVHDLSSFVSNPPDLWLPQLLGRDGHRVSSRLVFAVDNFVQLVGNHYWSDIRRPYADDDLIADLYGNVVLLRDVTGHAWPGTKVR